VEELLDLAGQHDLLKTIEPALHFRTRQSE